MVEVRSYGKLPSGRPNGSRDDRGLLACLRVRRGIARTVLGTVTLWMTGLCPSYVVLEAAPRQPVDPVCSLTLIGLALSFIYVPLYLTSSPERPFPTTTGL